MFEGLERKLSTVAGTQITCTVAGSGPPVSMLHGFPRTLPCGRGSLPRLRRISLWFVPICAAMPVRPNPNAYRTDQTTRFGPLRMIRSVLCADSALRASMSLATTAAAARDSDVHGYRPTHRRRPLALVFSVATRTVSRTADRQRCGFLLRDLFARLGATKIADLDPEMLDAYRRSWRDPAMIRGSWSDDRAAASIDLEQDAVDIDPGN
jgi:haloacetate dehalogenase